jgi:para-nitrobenzyl esterase
MVWLHGGGFSMGSSADPQYEGSALCRRGDVVVVTLNHRLNALGYLYLGALHADFADSGNAGQHDQVLALEWVRDNIAEFGGDPGNVTIFGESGGGAKVSTLLGMPSAKGLFHKAIIQSGPGVTMVGKDSAAELAERTLEALGITKADVHRLETLEARAILAAAQKVAPTIRGKTLSPVVDGRGLPREPFSPDAPDSARDVALIIGSNKDEGALFLAADPQFGVMTPDAALARFRSMLGPKAEPAFELYRSLRPNDPPTYWVTALITDTFAGMDSIRIAERKAAQGGAPVYMYRFDWETPILGGALRCPHGLEVPLVFDNPQSKRPMLGPGPEPARLAAVFSTAWTNFARTGDPSQPGLAWPAYDALARKTMIFNTSSAVVSDPAWAKREFWGA